MVWRSVLLGWLMLATLGLSSLLAEETRYVASGRSPLTVRSGPGVDYEAQTRLPHGTEVIVQEYRGGWARVTRAPGDTTGWVPQQYLTVKPPPDLAERLDMSPDHERRRFSRLQRKGIIATKQSGTRGVSRLTIHPLIWYRLTPHQQENFLRRAQRYYGGTSVEMYNERNDALLARLTATGDVEFATSPFDTPSSDDDLSASPLPQSRPDGPGSTR